jgi:hypothetical protein
MKDSKYYEDLESKGYFESIDKRSKDYRDYKDWLKTKDNFTNLKENIDNDVVGLGDAISAITKATGIDKVVKAVVGDDCGCDERKEKFNKIPLWKRRKVNCVNESDYPFLKYFVGLSKFTYEDRERIIPIYNHIFNTKIKNSSCNSCFRSYQRNLKDYLDIYDK